MTYINSITICPQNVTIKKGKWYYNTYAEICPTNATCKCLVWHSSNSNVASVNEDGDICGVSEGVAVVYATAQDGSGAVGFCTVTVVAPVMVESVTVIPSQKTVTVGDTFGLSATVCPQNAEDKRIRWTSCDCNIANVDYLTGCVTAKSAGTTYIYANAVDGSGVQGCCEVTCNVPNDIQSGTDSIGGFRMLSTLSAAPADAEADAPGLLGVQFKELDSGNFSVRFVSQIKTLNYNNLGYEIHSKFGNNASVAEVICSKIVYHSLIAGGEDIYPEEGYTYFYVAVIENVPENTVASFKIKPFAITSTGAYVYGDTVLFSCKDAEKIDDVNFETPERLSTLDHIRVNTGNGSNLSVMSLPGENSTVLGQFSNETEIFLLNETPQNEKWYAVYGQTIDGTYKLGWCSGEYLEKEVDFLRCVYDVKPIKVRNSPIAINDDRNKVGKISKGAEVELLDKSVPSQDMHLWYKVRYNRQEAYVVADEAEDDYDFFRKWIVLAQDIIKKRIYAATVYAEAAGQSRKSKQAVAHVMNNRIGTHGLWVDIEAVVSASGQFEGYGNSMYQDAMSYYETGIWSNSIEQAAMDECMSVITSIYNGEESDVTGGALYFHSFSNPEDWTYHNYYTLITVDGTEGFWFYK